ncbi:hypothetical protein ACQ33O_07105 [Ferruginibacter sp. SUN002]|uniref:hypothetical protein n=1 Tax=Ferruginibacter sp. SUN002 TaxID=2937789 RepID=UPI003D35B918
MNRKLILALMLTLATTLSFAQDKEEEEEEKSGFKKENLFTGGSIDAVLSNGTTAFGVSPFFGYSVIRWLDVAASLNFNYISQRDPYSSAKARQTIIGPGALVRVFPIKEVFFQAQYEHNFIREKYMDGYGGSYIQKYEANSLLVGGGYASGRSRNNDPYYFVSILVDVLSNSSSPYRDAYGRVVPIYRAGIVVPLFQGKSKR